MPWTRPTLEQIKTRIVKGIESRLTGNVALLRRALLRIIARAFAGAIHTSYGYLAFIVRQIFVITAEDPYLIWHGKKWGVNRKAASFAAGQVKFTGVDGALIEEDTRWQTDEGVEYGTLSDVTISGGEAIVDTQAVEAGTDGNLAVTSTGSLIEPIDDVDNEVTVTTAIEGGVDAEDPEAHRLRILQRIQFPPMGGNDQDYIRWATSVVGVGRAWTYPLADGAGTVGVAIITSDPDNPVPSAQLLADTQAYMDDEKPVTADLTVYSITDSSGIAGFAEIDLELSISPDKNELRLTIEENIKSLFAPHKPGTDIILSQLRSAISNSGVTDYLINGIAVDGISVPEDDIALTGYAYPQLGTITWAAL